VPLKTAALEIQTLVGDCETDTQATQQQPRHLAMLLPDKTSQPCAAAVLAYVDEGLGQVERLAACHLKAGLVQGAWHVAMLGTVYFKLLLIRAQLC
jgi:hypothetical protein